jgi:anti-sigma regulatory factor (Ser/Thr protein kinase)
MIGEAMSTKTFLVPKDHVLEQVLQFGRELAICPDEAAEYVFDFQGKGMDTPFGMLFLSFAVQKFIKEHPAAKHKPVNHEERSYAAHMGYFRTCGFQIGNLPGQAHGSDTYFPITIIPVAHIQKQAKDQTRQVGDVIEEYSQKLSCILLQQDDGPLAEMLSYTFRELLRNIVEHSGSETIAFCAQFRRKMKQAEIAILDTGIGVRSALSNNPYLNIGCDHDALNLALMPGISGKMFKGIKRDPYDGWQNSGYGLFAVSRLCGHGGKFTICSGDTALSLKPEKKEYHPASFQGTALRIILSAKEVKNARSALAAIMKEGDRLVKEVGIEGAQASTASKMLSMEFNQSKKE